MPKLDAMFSTEVDNAVAITKASERLFMQIGESYRPIHHTRIEHLYELAYLRIFISWEVFLEASFLRYLCGHRSVNHGIAVMTNSRNHEKTLDDAELLMLGGQDYFLWANVKKSLKKATSLIHNGRHEVVIAGSQGLLNHFAAIRNRIAHGQPDAVAKFENAAMALCGRRNFGSRAGRFLRAFDTTVSPHLRWIESIAATMKGLAAAIV